MMASGTVRSRATSLTPPHPGHLAEFASSIQKGQALDAQLRQLEAQVDRQAEIARVGLSLDEFCRRVREGLDRATWAQKRQLIEWLVARVIVTDGEVEIRYVIPTSPAGEATRFCHLRSDYRAALGQAEGVAGCCHPPPENPPPLPWWSVS